MSVLINKEFGCVVSSIYLDNVSVVINNDAYNGCALIDTGATKSFVSFRVANKMEWYSMDFGHANTANGLAIMRKYYGSIIIGDMKFDNLIISAVDTQNEIIIGMDVLSQCNVIIKNENNQTVFTLETIDDN